MKEKVLLTGATGFLGSHVLIQLLNAGYAVRGSMRSLSKKDHLMSIISPHIPEDAELEFVESRVTLSCTLQISGENYGTYHNEHI